MKKTIFACLIALSLVACGGYNTVSVGGTVSSTTNTPGQSISGLVLALNGSPYQIATFPADGSLTKYVFPSQLSDTGAQYNVTVQTQPVGWNCVVAHGTGYTSGVTIDVANVTCTILTYPLQGVVHTLTSTGLQLTNVITVTGAGTETISVSPDPVTPGNDVTFKFTNPVTAFSTYTITPTNPTTPITQTCTINSGGTATNVTANPLTIDITCI